MEVQVLSPAPMKRKVGTYFPLEMWLLAVPSLILSVWAIFYIWANNLGQGSFVSNVIFSLVGERFLEGGLIFIYMYMYLRFVYIVAKKLQSKESAKSIWKELVKFFRSIIFWMATIAIATYAFSAVLSIIFKTNSFGDMALASDMLLHWDIALFHTYPANALNVFFTNHSFVGAVSFYSYMMISVFISTTLVLLLCSNTKKFRQFLLSFCLVGFIGLIFWHFIPATSERGYIDVNVTHASSSMIGDYKATPAPVTIPYLEATDKLWIDPTGRSFNVSTFPSMHAAWATLVLLALLTTWRKLGILITPWFVALCLGAVAIYQHYAVDIFAGIILAVIVFFSVGKLLDREERYFKDKYQLMYIWETLQKDVLKARKWALDAIARKSK